MTLSPPAGTERPRKIIKKVRKKDIGDKPSASDSEPEYDAETPFDSTDDKPLPLKKKKKKKKKHKMQSAESADERIADDTSDASDDQPGEPDSDNEPAASDDSSDWDNASDISEPGGATLNDVSPDILREEAERTNEESGSEPDAALPSPESGAPTSSRRKKKKIIRRKVRKKDLEARKAELGKETTIDTDGVIDTHYSNSDADIDYDAEPSDETDSNEPSPQTDSDDDDWNDGDGAQPAETPEPEEQKTVKDSSRRSKRATVRGSRRSNRGSATTDDESNDPDAEPVSKEDRRARNRRKARNFIIMSAVLIALAIPTAIGYWVYRHKVKQFVKPEATFIKYETFGEKNTLNYLAELLEVPVEELLACNPEITDKNKPLGAKLSFMIPAKYKQTIPADWKVLSYRISQHCVKYAEETRKPRDEARDIIQNYMNTGDESQMPSVAAKLDEARRNWERWEKFFDSIVDYKNETGVVEKSQLFDQESKRLNDSNYNIRQLGLEYESWKNKEAGLGTLNTTPRVVIKPIDKLISDIKGKMVSCTLGRQRITDARAESDRIESGDDPMSKPEEKIKKRQRSIASAVESMKKYETEIDALVALAKTELEKMEASSPNYNKFQEQLKTLEDEIAKMKRENQSYYED